MAEGDIVFKKGMKSWSNNLGDSGHHFYIIIEGSVGIYVTVNNDEDELEEI